MSQLLQTPEQWAEEDKHAHRAATDKASEQRVDIFLDVARVLKKWDNKPITRADFDAGMEAARKC